MNQTYSLDGKEVMHTDFDSQYFGLWLIWRQRRQNSSLWEKGHNGRHAGNLVISDSHSFCVQLATTLDPLILRGHNGLRKRYPETFLYIQFSRIKKRQFGTLLYQKSLMSPRNSYYNSWYTQSRLQKCIATQRLYRFFQPYVSKYNTLYFRDRISLCF
jgi:hypothetical protein